MPREIKPSRILIVEDEGIVASDIAKCLEGFGFEVSGIAASAEDAMAAVAFKNPDLVLIHITIEGPVDGIQAAHEIHKLYELPIIFLTAHGDRDTIERAKAIAPFAFLPKPFKPNELKNAIEIALRRSQADKELRERERFFAIAMDSIGDSVLTADRDGKIRFMNHAAELLTGWRHEQASERTVAEVVNVVEHFAGDRERFRVLLDFSPAPIGNPSSQDYCIHRPHDGFRWLRARAASMDASGSGSIRVLVMEDITDKRETEIELRQANHDLEQFAYSASHDLQEPIRNIAIYSQLISRSYSQMLDTDGREFLNYVTDGAKRMEQLVKDLLAYTQAAQAPLENHPESDAAAALADALSNLFEPINETLAQITYDTLPKLPVRTSELQQLFQNLIGNALKYRNRQEPPRIHIAVARDLDRWIFSVEDNGIGIAPEHKDIVFGVFKRLHTASRYPGTGIGLAICQKIVARHSGRIWVESEVGKGSTFFFSLPRSMEMSFAAAVPG